MTQTLPYVAHEHHERLLHHVQELPGIADMLLGPNTTEVRPTLAASSSFLTETLLPHIDAAERALYPELERLFQNRHSMGPMRREHGEIRRLVGDLARLTDELEPGPVAIGKALALRRVLFHLYSLLRIHLAEEEAYLHIVEHGVTADVADVLAAAMDHPGIRPG